VVELRARSRLGAGSGGSVRFDEVEGNMTAGMALLTQRQTCDKSITRFWRCKPNASLRDSRVRMAIMAYQTSRSALSSGEIDRAVARFGSEMFGLALSITGNVPDAEDAYQTSWMDASRHWGQLVDPEKRRSWLASIVARSALRTRRRRLNWLSRHVPLAAAETVADVMRWDPAFAQALTRLSGRQRAVVALHYGHGYSLDETAALIGCSGGAARSHLSRALTTLRRSMSDDPA